MSEDVDLSDWLVGNKALNTALAKAQGAFPNVKRGHEADAGAFKYSYASLDAVLDVIRKPLAENGLALVQLPEGGGLRTELRHAEGGSIVSVWPWPTVPENIQAYGKLVSYMRRYAILCVLGLATEDDDGAGVPTEKITADQKAKIGELLAQLKAEAAPAEGHLSWDGELKREFKVRSRDDLSKAQAGAAIGWLKKKIDDVGIPFG